MPVSKPATFLMCAAAALAASGDIQVLEEVVARVNGDIVTRSQLLRPGAGLADRIDRLLLLQKGRELNIDVQAEVSKRLADIQRASGLGDAGAFAEYIRARAGMPFEDYVQSVREEFLCETVLQQEVAARIVLPVHELRRYYEDNRDEFIRRERILLSEIFVPFDNDDASVEAARRKAHELADHVRRGEAFGELARVYSGNPAAAAFHGRLEPAGRDDLLPEIAAAVWDRPKGTVTHPIRLANGYVVLRVDDQHRAGLASFDEVEGEIAHKLRAARFAARVREYLTRLRRGAFVRIRPGYVDASAAGGHDTSWDDPLELKPERVSRTDLEPPLPRRKRLLWILPAPATRVEPVSSSR